MEIGEKIRNAREDLDLSQREVAIQIPMNQSNYSKIERGLQQPSLDQLKRICEILFLDPAELLGLKPSTYPYENARKCLAEIRDLIKKYGVWQEDGPLSQQRANPSSETTNE